MRSPATSARAGLPPATGTIEFKLYATADCSGPPVDDETVKVSGDGSYATTAGYEAAAAGPYQWTAAYTGDGDNNPAATKCGDEPVTINRASPALSTSPIPATGPIGTVLQDSANLTGSSGATGTIEFKLYATADCSGPPVDDETVKVTGDGSYATSTGARAAAAGPYQWTAAYTGDGNNNPAATKCGDEPVTISQSGSRLYWTDEGRGQIWEAGLDGSNPQPLPIPPQQNLFGVAVSGSTLYWTAGGVNGQIWEAGPDGSNAQPLPIPPQQGPVGWR